MEVLGIVLFAIIFFLILKGYPVAFTLSGVSILFALFISVFYPEHFSMSSFNLIPYRIMGVINNYVLMAIPLFIFMGVILEKSGLAKSLLETMAMLLGRIRGGLAISVLLVGVLLAASTGIVGATVVTMGLISLPTMLKRGYNAELATGIISSSGTLGQIVPPSIVLVLLADTVNSSSRSSQSVDVGSLFSAVIIPSLILILMYFLYIIFRAVLDKDSAPLISKEELLEFRQNDFWKNIFNVIFLPGVLIFVVLGSIFTGVASPTEASAIGACGATLLSFFQKKLNLKILKQAATDTTKVTVMVFFVLLGATTFTLVFREIGGDDYLRDIIISSNLSPIMFLILVMGLTRIIHSHTKID
ncbi:TRAP transporter large permease [Ichthyobacterium seriolicida]|uniref:TRAP dicarboxylate transporter subunit DctM n=1 Tax=Ichthyobacterium seriolicida TaxID=242600 RepID=A0A1J1EAQ4_9FLAO|nr:TRAP transporter large permease subunit [Ichthyobacterium seriolicida]BAV95019.1 TRAP dicarboxylate transporter subunit DctM [Ichthyobacterium seriolicida]